MVCRAEFVASKFVKVTNPELSGLPSSLVKSDIACLAAAAAVLAAAPAATLAVLAATSTVPLAVLAATPTVAFAVFAATPTVALAVLTTVPAVLLTRFPAKLNQEFWLLPLALCCWSASSSSIVSSSPMVLGTVAICSSALCSVVSCGDTDADKSEKDGSNSRSLADSSCFNCCSRTCPCSGSTSSWNGSTCRPYLSNNRCCSSYPSACCNRSICSIISVISSLRTSNRSYKTSTSLRFVSKSLGVFFLMVSTLIVCSSLATRAVRSLTFFLSVGI
mmetsp:Transcript_27140/g.44825  ORF Transcript_27140/g.44825 Transcript_27140/m.44825 type:complete len:276 (+) Transcript_27140:227-1054(+)